MNDDLRSALEQLECAASEKRGTTLLPGEPQALLDEREALRKALEDALATFQYLYTHDDYLKRRNFKNIPAVRHGLAVIAKTRNEEA